MNNSLERNKNIEIHSGDFITVKFDGLDDLYSYLYIQNDNGYDEESYLINMDDRQSVYISKYFFNVRDKKTNIEMVLDMLEHLDFTLVEVIPSKQIDIRRI